MSEQRGLHLKTLNFLFNASHHIFVCVCNFLTVSRFLNFVGKFQSKFTSFSIIFFVISFEQKNSFIKLCFLVVFHFFFVLFNCLS